MNEYLIESDASYRVSFYLKLPVVIGVRWAWWRMFPVVTQSPRWEMKLLFLSEAEGREMMQAKDSFHPRWTALIKAMSGVRNPVVYSLSMVRIWDVEPAQTNYVRTGLTQ